MKKDQEFFVPPIPIQTLLTCWISRERIPDPFSCNFRQYFSMGQKHAKNAFCLFPLVVQWLLITRFGALAHPLIHDDK